MKKQSRNKKLHAFLALLLCVLMCTSVILLTSCGSCDTGLDGIDDLFEIESESNKTSDSDSEVQNTDESSDTGESGESIGTDESMETGESGESSESDESDESDESEELDSEKRISVVRVKRAAAEGDRLTASDFELVEVPESAVPQGAITSIEALAGKYATINIVVGEYMFDRMVSDNPPAEEEVFVGYIVVTDEIDNAENKDITAELQSLINRYPGRTLYFSDGVYNISAPLVLKTENASAVSLRLSNYAVIKALSTWTSENAMITVGSTSDATKAEGAEISVMGGVIDGAGVAKIGLSFENCKSPFVSNVTFKNLKTSLWAKSSASSPNFESVTVNGDGSADSIGILIESSGGVFSTSNVANVAIGIKNSGSYNDFRNVLAYADPSVTTKCAFWENGTNNVFEMCTSQNFTCGFLMKNGATSVFEACNSYWQAASVAEQTAFSVDGTFNSVISGCTVKFFDATSNNALIKFTTKGSGVIKVPIFDEALCDDQSYKSVLSDSVIPLT